MMGRPMTSQRAEAQMRLDRIDLRLEDASPELSVMADASGTHLITGHALDPVVIATIRPEAAEVDRELILHAIDDLRWLRSTYARLATAYRKLVGEPEPEPRKAGNYAAQCAMMCDRQAFRNYLATVLGKDVSDGERVRVAVHEALSIASRKELNTDPAAARRWRDLLGDFEAWQRTN